MKKEYPDVEWSRPSKPLLTVVAERKGAPTRLVRWCCDLYKELGGKGKVKITGVRAAESKKRKQNWRILTPWKRDGSWIVNPILFWTDEDVWKFIRDNDIPYCPLYDEGFKRLGCVGCPLGAKGNRLKEFKRWPGYERAWKRALTRFWEKKKDTLNRQGKPFWVGKFKSAEDYWHWWVHMEQPEEGCTMGLF
jgi:phosphoadenosine phosphosulfate reductase